jgi:ABC-2 type transport system permease protein
MRTYLAFFKMRLLAGLQYRAAALAGMGTQLVWGILEVLLYRAFWLENPDSFPMDMAAVSAYIWLQQAFLSCFALWYWEQDLFDAVKSGTVAYELVRPVDLYGMWMARSLALRLSRAALRAGPILLLAVLLPSPYGLRCGVSLPVFGLFLLSMALMLVVVCAFVQLLYALSFHMTDATGMTTFLSSVASVLSGNLVPLPFLPEKLRTFAALTPFGSMQNVPFRIFSGDISLADMPAALGLQAFWAVALIVAGAWIMRGGVRRAVIAGG